MGIDPQDAVELFLDDELLSFKENIETRIESPERFPEPIMAPEYPWEKGGTTLYGSVLIDDGIFRMWYMACGESGQQTMCHAESLNGLSWQKTMMTLAPYAESKLTNIVLGPDINVHGPCVLRNQNRQDIQRKYLVFYDSYAKYRAEEKNLQSSARWTFTGSSSDGFIWAPAKGIPAVPGKSDTGQSVIWDQKKGRYLAYMRGVMYDHSRQRIRYVRLSTSSDFVNWSSPVELLRAEQINGDAYNQLHQLSVTLYHNTYIGLLSYFHILELDRDSSGVPTYNSRPYPELASCDTWLAVSRDGIPWKLVSDKMPFLALRPGHWDGMFITTASQLVFHDKQIWIYYAGTSTRQGEKDQMEVKSIGVSRLPAERLAALATKNALADGLIELKPIIFRSPDELELNVQVHPGGNIAVELCDYAGKVITGFSRDDCVHINADSLRYPVTWKSEKGPKRFADITAKTREQPIRIRFYLKNAKLYAFNAAHKLAV